MCLEEQHKEPHRTGEPVGRRVYAEQQVRRVGNEVSPCRVSRQTSAEDLELQ